MNIAVLGTGMVGRAIAARLAELGHVVTIGSRDPEATTRRIEPDAIGTPPYRDWAAVHPAVQLATFAEAASAAELVVNATSGAATLDALGAAGGRVSVSVHGCAWDSVRFRWRWATLLRG